PPTPRHRDRSAGSVRSRTGANATRVSIRPVSRNAGRLQCAAMPSSQGLRDGIGDDARILMERRERNSTAPHPVSMQQTLHVFNRAQGIAMRVVFAWIAALLAGFAVVACGRGDAGSGPTHSVARP